MVAKSVQMVRRFTLILCAVAGNLIAQGPFAPQAGEPGSDAISKDSAIFRDWAISCDVIRGPRQIDLPDSGLVTAGNQLYATGKVDAPLTLSLGDGGSATLQFMGTMFDGPGPDFAVFENGFGSGDQAFLELAFVEASSDGVHYFRFPSESLTDTSVQVSSFDPIDASFVHNFAGKYTVNYGTPFDLADLPDTSLLDKQHVTHVRIIDVVGCLNPAFGSLDAFGRLVNDPWPTNFPQGGFDLDAVMVINSNLPLNISKKELESNSSKSYYDILGNRSNAPQPGLNVTINQSGHVVKEFIQVP